MAATLDMLVNIRSQLAEALLAYFQQVIAAPDAQDKLPLYLGGRKPSQLFLSPDVLKKEQNTVQLDSQSKRHGARIRDKETHSTQGNLVLEHAQFACW